MLASIAWMKIVLKCLFHQSVFVSQAGYVVVVRRYKVNFKSRNTVAFQKHVHTIFILKNPSPIFTKCVMPLFVPTNQQ